MIDSPDAEASTRRRRFGRYEVISQIASGGMATVFLGRALGAKGFARLVAIKRLHPHLESDQDFVAMFFDEARLAARIRHPNVVPTLDVDDREGLFTVMEYVEGEALSGLLRRADRAGARIPLPIALRIAVDALSGLHAAHELTDDAGAPLRLVHRDVSPHNLLVGLDGITKLTDFGIAKAESRLASTRDGQLKGKIAYMAPEQVASGELDRRADVFAMGIVLWEMLSGRRLFRAENDVAGMHAILHQAIAPPSSIVPEIPPALDTVVMRALERDCARRWPTAAAFGDALERVATESRGLAHARIVAEYVRAAGVGTRPVAAAPNDVTPSGEPTPREPTPSVPGRDEGAASDDRLTSAVTVVSRTRPTRGTIGVLAAIGILTFAGAGALLGLRARRLAGAHGAAPSTDRSTALRPPLLDPPPAATQNPPDNAGAAGQRVAESSSDPRSIAPESPSVLPRRERATRRVSVPSRRPEPTTATTATGEVDPIATNPYRR